MTDDDRALVVLYSSKQEFLKASSTSALVGKKRKEATATETTAYQKQFLKAKHLECKSWLDNEGFDLVDTHTHKVQVRNWVIGRWVLALKARQRRELSEDRGSLGPPGFSGQAEK